MLPKFISILAIAFAFSFCQATNYPDSKPVNHQIWDDLLKRHVNAAGLVNYAGFVKDTARLNEYLRLLSANHPDPKTWSREEQLAYWINAYNAFTVKLVVDAYPVKSIKDIKRGIAFVNSVWDIKFIKIGKETYDLNNIEHGILRKKFEEPRIHFAVNCASISCPKLRNEAFTAARLDEQLTDAARQFLNDKSRNDISAKAARLSKIFSWFHGDFTKKGTFEAFINKYSAVKITKNTKISHLDYDWNLNKQ